MACLMLRYAVVEIPRGFPENSCLSRLTRRLLTGRAQVSVRLGLIFESKLPGQTADGKDSRHAQAESGPAPSIGIRLRSLLNYIPVVPAKPIEDEVVGI